MVQFKTTTGRTVEIPSVKVATYVYKDGKYEKHGYDVIDMTKWNIIEGDGSADYKCRELLDLLRVHKMLVSDVIYSSALKKNELFREMSVYKENVKHARAKMLMKYSADGWTHKEKCGDVVKASSGVLEKIVDGDETIVLMLQELAKMQEGIDNLSAKIENYERQYFNMDDAVKTLTRIFGYT